MSIQFGICNFDGRPVDPNDLDPVRSLLPLYGPDQEARFCGDGIGIVYGGFHTTLESRGECQPHASPSGVVVTWDGRLDNREELLHALGSQLQAGSSDVAIVTAAYDKWATGCFERLLGDWAASIWVPGQGLLILAKDFLGARPLYYRIDKHQALWSTVLNPLVGSTGEVELNEEYIAGWLSMFPATHLTPYRGIHAVPPSSYVMVRRERATITAKVREFWTFNGGKRVRYRTDAEYEEHFRILFAQSVRRRLRSDATIIAELSGGMDSSSIVCMADQVLGRGGPEAVRVETVSYYDDSEPNWNERPFFTKVEERRGRAGCHIDSGFRENSDLEPSSGHFEVTPGSQGGKGFVALQLAAYMRSQGSRVLLSGIGGDEVTGGVPTPVPELADLLARARLDELAHQLKVWALKQRRPWFHLLSEAVREFLPFPHLWVAKYSRPAPWLNPSFVRRNRAASCGYPSRVKLFGPLPSFQENMATLNFVRRHLASTRLSSEPYYEKRYPYLDRDLLEFLYAVPRDQLVRPGQRRSLMRRALAGIVPDEILNRKRKAYVTRSSSLEIVSDWDKLLREPQQLTSSRLGIVIAEEFAKAVKKVREGRDVAVVPLYRTLAIERWLSHLRGQEISRLAREADEALVDPKFFFLILASSIAALIVF
jgi:asparagine synthase (glutamine-hydrolysing)